MNELLQLEENSFGLI